MMKDGMNSQIDYIDTPEVLDEAGLLGELKKRIEAINSSDDTRVISIIGGAGSGKTTLASRLKEVMGDADTLGTDDYVVGDRAYRREYLEGQDPTKKYSPEKLNSHIAQIKKLSEGEQLLVPTYNEQTGMAVDADTYARTIAKVKYLIVEGDFDFVEHPDLLIYFDVPDEVRLQNRVARDQQTRDANADEIIASFQLRQEMQHLPYTLPTKDKADLVIEAQSRQDDDGQTIYQYQVKDNAHG